MQIFVCGSRAERLAQSLLSRSNSRARVGGGADKGGSDGPDIAMQMNPRLMQDLRSSASDGSGGISAELIESLDDAPSAATWSQLRGSIAQVLRNARSLATENAALKKSLERVEAGGDISAAMGTYGASPQAVLGPKSRREFAQVGSAGGGTAASMRGLASFGSSRQLQGALQRSPSQRPASLARPGSSGALSSSGGGGSSPSLELAPLNASSPFASANPLAGSSQLQQPGSRKVAVAVSRRSTSRGAGAGASAATESPLAGLARGALGAVRSDISPLLLPMEGEGTAPAMEPLPRAE